MCVRAKGRCRFLRIGHLRMDAGLQVYSAAVIMPFGGRTAVVDGWPFGTD